MLRALLAESVPGALEDRKNWAFEAFAFDALAVLATVAVAIRAVRTNGAEIQPARKASCQSKCVVGFRVAAAALMALAPGETRLACFNRAAYAAKSTPRPAPKPALFPPETMQPQLDAVFSQGGSGAASHWREIALLMTRVLLVHVRCRFEQAI
jgi:hypothetical protein